MKRIIIAALLIFVCSSSLFAWTNYSDVFKDVAEGSNNILAYSICDNHRSLTHAAEGDLSLSGYGFYYDIDTLYKYSKKGGAAEYEIKSLIEGDDLTCLGYGMRVDYAFYDHWSVYAAYNNAAIDGGMNGYYYKYTSVNMGDDAIYASSPGRNYHIDGIVESTNYRFGLAWDIWGGDVLSIPVHCGLARSTTSFVLNFSPGPGNTIDPWINTEFEFTNTCYDVGLSASLRFLESFTYTVFCGYVDTLNESTPLVKNTVAKDNVDSSKARAGESVVLDGSIFVGTFGYVGNYFTYNPLQSDFSIYVSMMGVFSKARNQFSEYGYNGLQFERTITLGVAYRFNVHTMMKGDAE